jgi:hypothetical protein
LIQSPPTQEVQKNQSSDQDQDHEEKLKTLIPGFEWQPGFAGLAPAQRCTPQAEPKAAPKNVLAEMAAVAGSSALS